MRGLEPLRFHPKCFYRAREDAPRETWPALIAAVTDTKGMITGVLRTWLARDGSGKAPIATPRRAMGHLLGNGVRFGVASPATRGPTVIAAGEGLETMLALRCVLPGMPMIAALSATHLAALVLPLGLQRLYVARDNDRAGHRAAEMLATRAKADGIEVLVLTPQADDFNTDLVALGPDALAHAVRAQLAPQDEQRLVARPEPVRLRPFVRVAAAVRQVRPRRQPRPAFRWGDRARSGRGPQRLRAAFFPWRRERAPPFLARQESRARRPPLALRPCRRNAFGCGPRPLPACCIA